MPLTLTSQHDKLEAIDALKTLLRVIGYDRISREHQSALIRVIEEMIADPGLMVVNSTFAAGERTIEVKVKIHFEG